MKQGKKEALTEEIPGRCSRFAQQSTERSERASGCAGGAPGVVAQPPQPVLGTFFTQSKLSEPGNTNEGRITGGASKPFSQCV